MPRAAGQIDVAKNEAILDAAAVVLSMLGVSAPMAEIARRAGVSKQTIYNHYGSKAELVQALCARRVEEMTHGLTMPDASLHPGAALAIYARGLLRVVTEQEGAAFLRMAISAVDTLPDVARAFFEAGPRTSRAQLAEFLRIETEAGRLSCPDPLEAAEFFGGMVLGSYQTAALLGVDRGLDEAGIDRIVSEAAMRFLKAYAA